MHVAGPLCLLQVGGDEREQVVDGDVVLSHDAGGDGVALDDRLHQGRAFLAVGRARGGGGPDDLRAGLLEAGEDLAEALLVVGLGRAAVVEAEVEVDHVPLALAQPDVELLDPVGGGSAVLGGLVDVGLAGQRLADAKRVAARDRVADQQDARQLGVVADEVPAGRTPLHPRPLVDGQVEAAEVLLERALPGLLVGGEGSDQVGVLPGDDGVFGRGLSDGGASGGGLGGLGLRPRGRCGQQGDQRGGKQGDRAAVHAASPDT